MFPLLAVLVLHFFIGGTVHAMERLYIFKENDINRPFFLNQDKNVMLIDMHCHTYPKSRCSRILPGTLLRRALKSGLDGIVLTEHHYLWPQKDLENLREKACIPDWFVLMAAQEVETELGHVLVYGADRTIAKKISLEHLRGAFPDACLIWAHPWRDGKIPSPNDLEHPLLDGIEVLNGNQSVIENYRALSAWHRYRFKAIGGSDVHNKKRVATFPTIFDHPVGDMDSLIRQLRGACARPLLTQRREWVGKSIGIRVHLGTRTENKSTNFTVKQIAVDEEAWKDALERADLVEYIRKGRFDKGYFRIPKIIGRDDMEKAILERNLKGQNLGRLLPSVPGPVKSLLLNGVTDWLIHLHGSELKLSSYENTLARERSFLRMLKGFYDSVPYRYRAGFRDTLLFMEEYETAELGGNESNYIQIHGNITPASVIYGYETVFDHKPSYVAVLDCEHTMLWDPAYDIAKLSAHLRYEFRKTPEVFSEMEMTKLVRRWAEGLSIVDDQHLKRRLKAFMIRADLGILYKLLDERRSGSSEFKWVMKQILNAYKQLK